jgi:hypothetical protein
VNLWIRLFRYEARWLHVLFIGISALAVLLFVGLIAHCATLLLNHSPSVAESSSAGMQLIYSSIPEDSDTGMRLMWLSLAFLPFVMLIVGIQAYSLMKYDSEWPRERILTKKLFPLHECLPLVICLILSISGIVLIWHMLGLYEELLGLESALVSSAYSGTILTDEVLNGFIFRKKAAIAGSWTVFPILLFMITTLISIIFSKTAVGMECDPHE